MIKDNNYSIISCSPENLITKKGIDISTKPIAGTVKKTKHLNKIKALSYFRNKYDRVDLNMIGRYKNDAYYDGQLWIICTLGLLQYYMKLTKNNKYKSLEKVCLDVFNYIISIDINFDIAEQYDPVNNKQMSAEKLTWNYSELYITYKDIKSLNIKKN